MKYSDKEVRKAAIARVARIFNIEENKLSLNARFGQDLNESFVSNWKDNELDEILYDIHDVADRTAKKKINNGEVVIITVNDYCDFMVDCYKSKPNIVVDILFGKKS